MRSGDFLGLGALASECDRSAEVLGFHAGQEDLISHYLFQTQRR